MVVNTEDAIVSLRDERKENNLLAIVSESGSIDLGRRLSLEIFSDHRYQRIAQAMLAVISQGKPPIPAHVIAELRKSECLEIAGGLAFVSGLADDPPPACAFDSLLTDLQELAFRRGCLASLDDFRARLTDLTRDAHRSAALLAESLQSLPQVADNLPAPRAWLDIQPSDEESADAILVGPGNWLTRGSGCFIVGPTGCGKSTLDATLSFSWSIGREVLGLKPTRPLKSLVIQAEDDDLDLAQMAAGIVGSIAPTSAEQTMMRENVILVTERAKTGEQFLALVAGLLDRHRPDLVHVNPLSAFFGNDLNDQREVARFFRNGLNPLLARYRCAALPVHHVPKPSKDRDGWRDGAMAYLGAGSADLANWAREVLTLRQTAPGLYELTATKRWRKLGWTDGENRPTGTRLIAHGLSGHMVWRDASPDVLDSLGARPYSAKALLELVPEPGTDKAELVKQVVDTFSVSERTAKTYVADACRLRRHVFDGAAIKCSLLSERNRPRKEVYPDQPANRPVVWVSLSDEGRRLCNR